MAELSPEEIDHLAALARVRLSDAERARLAKELPEIITFVEKLGEIREQLTDVELAPVPLEQLREDEVSGTRLSLAELEKLAPKWRNDQVEVPAVFGDNTDV